MKKSKYLTVLRLEKKRNDQKKKMRSFEEKERKAESIATQTHLAMIKAMWAVDEPGASGREDDAYYKAMEAHNRAIKDYYGPLGAIVQRGRARTRLENLNYQLGSKLLPLGLVRRSKATKLRRSR